MVTAEQPGLSETTSEDPDGKRSFWRALRGIFETTPEASLRARLAEVIADYDPALHPDTASIAGDLTGFEREMLRNLLQFGERAAGDVAIPRGGIIALPETASWAEVIAAFAEHGHSRLPVYRDTLDKITGMILMKDVFGHLATYHLASHHLAAEHLASHHLASHHLIAEHPGANPPAIGIPEERCWTSLIRQPLFVPQARLARDVLADMRHSRVHLAVVVDEYSGTDGIITFEDLVEEITGEIEDEHDDTPPAPLRRLADGSWEADAHARLDRIADDLEPKLAEVSEAVDTLGGLAYVLAGQVPAVGARLHDANGWVIEVTAGDERHVTALRLYPPEHRIAAD